jgi:hypothetical protein
MGFCDYLGPDFKEKLVDLIKDNFKLLCNNPSKFIKKVIDTMKEKISVKLKASSIPGTGAVRIVMEQTLDLMKTQAGLVAAPLQSALATPPAVAACEAGESDAVMTVLKKAIDTSFTKICGEAAAKAIKEEAAIVNAVSAPAVQQPIMPQLQQPMMMPQQPIMQQPMMQQPMMQQPMMQPQMMQQPMMQQPMMQQPMMQPQIMPQQPMMQPQMMQQPMMQPQIMQQPMMQPQIMQQPMMMQPMPTVAAAGGKRRRYRRKTRKSRKGRKGRKARKSRRTNLKA